MDLEKFEQFRRKFDPSFATKTASQGGQSKNSIKWPASQGGQGGSKPASNDDDLYSWSYIIIILNLMIKLKGIILIRID